MTIREKQTVLRSQAYTRLDGDLDDVLAGVKAIFELYPADKYGTSLACFFWMGRERGFKAVVEREAESR